MQLCNLEVRHFRAFGGAALTLPAHGLVLIAGANNAGKTALLSALDVVAGVDGGVASWRHAGSANPARVVATFALDENERRSLFAASANREQFVAGGAGRRLQLAFVESGRRVPGLQEVRGEWFAADMQIFAAMNVDTDGHNWRPNVISAITGRNEPKPLQLRPQGSLRYTESTRLTDLDPHEGSGLKPVWTLLESWRARYYHFRALRVGTARTLPLASEDKLNPNGQNLSAVLLQLLTDHPDQFERIRKLVAEIVPDIGDLQVRTGGGQMQVTFSTPDADLNLKDLGSGVEQLLLTLVVGVTEAPPFTLVVEEPESSLHSAAQRALLGLLKSWAADRQIVAATHSPVMLNWSPIGQRLLHVTRRDGVSSVEPVRDDPSGLLDALGVRLSDVLSADRVLVVEGSSDEDVLEAWFPEVLRAPNVAVLHGGGGDSARHADRLAEWLEGVDTIGLRKVLYLRDRDELSPSALEKLEKSKTVGVLKRREIENYLLDSAAVATVLKSLNDSEDEPSPEAVATAMSECAENLRRKIVVNRVCSQVGPSEPIIPRTLRQRLAREGANKEQVTAALLRRLMTPEGLQGQIDEAWAAAESDVAGCSGDDLLAIAPGEEILDQVFLRFAKRRYNKREDGVAIAAAMSAAPEEIQRLIEAFMVEGTEEPAPRQP